LVFVDKVLNVQKISPPIFLAKTARYHNNGFPNRTRPEERKNKNDK
jgi:hypothetical protein